MNVFKKVRSVKKRYLILGGLLVLGLVWFFLLRPSGRSEVPHYTSVKQSDIKSTVSASGILTGKNSVNLHFPSGGKLAYINVKDGDSVTQGEIIAGLDAQALNLNLQQAQNTLRDKQAALEKVLDDIHLYQYGNGGFGNVGSPSETEAQRQDRTTAEVARDNALDSVKEAQRAFQDAVIVSPINGVVTQSEALPGQNVTAADTIAQVVDFSETVFLTDIDESDISKISVGQSAEVTLNAYGDKIIKGVVSEIMPLTKTSTNGAITVPVKITVSDVAVHPISGLNGQATITTSQKTNVLTIPIDALVNDNQVIVKTPQGMELKTVKTGVISDTDVEIIEGLHEGDQVVSNPANFVSRLQPRNQPNFLRRFLGGGRPGRG